MALNKPTSTQVTHPTSSTVSAELVTLQGDVAVLQAITNATYQVVSTNQTAVTLEAFAVDTTSGIVTITLPVGPTAGDIVSIADYAATFSTNVCTIGRNGQNIESLAEDHDLDKDRIAVSFKFIDTTIGWKII